MCECIPEAAEAVSGIFSCFLYNSPGFGEASSAEKSAKKEKEDLIMDQKKQNKNYQETSNTHKTETKQAKDDRSC